MNQQICLITGATDGIGKQTAIGLAKKGYKVVIVGRNKGKAEAVKKEIEELSTGSIVDYILADFTSLKQVIQLAETFKSRYSKLDVLINNIGIFSNERKLTEDGYEMCYQVNYLSQFFLSNLLLDYIKKSTQGRIINLCSMVYSKGRFDINNLQSEKKFSVLDTYADSKLLSLMFTMQLAEQVKGTKVTVNNVDPGIVRTQMVYNAPGLLKMFAYITRPFSVSPEKGAATSIYLASSEEVNNISGKYFKNSKAVATKNKFNTKENRELLWDISMKELQKSLDNPLSVEQK
jgi:NAD(P)-dependent dehydrogenase (short-subunit alcohol dehydrogenase family)